MGIFGWGGKPRSRLGRFLDKKRITQEELADMAGLSTKTVSKLCSDDEYKPQLRTASKIVKALRRFDKRIDVDDFWSV